MAHYKHRLPKFEETDAPSGSGVTSTGKSKGKQRATKPYHRLEQSASLEFKTFGQRLNGLESDIAAFVNSSEFVMTNEGRESCTKLMSSVQLATMHQQQATGHLVGNQVRYFEDEWTKREAALQIKRDLDLEIIVSQLAFEKGRDLDKLRGELILEKEEAIRAFKMCTICFDADKNCTLTKCAHTFCETCCMEMWGEGCAMCRAEVTGWVRMLFTD
ncbi:hypothetical protein DPMN_157463 [Dreissena polymorpha]|uniref:RING-type domain-containing protein n=1 Tax=Dreissena polymorpha TaxID=45954 RepID=A0A9D4IQ11_DREPO|nr:hypothetical protein DPMN_157463 [Dreissena polymorpha]